MAATSSPAPYQVLRIVQEDPRVSIRRVSSPRDGRSVLLKIEHSADPRAADALRRELEIGAALDPAVALRPVEMSTFGDRPALVLEDFGGVPLRQLLGAPMEVGLALRIAARLASCLESVHRKGLVHRNLRPENVYFDARTGEVKLTGFGSATPEDGHMAEGAAVEGAPPYVAPEQRGRIERPLDRRADLYSAGVVLVEMLTGVRPEEEEGDVLGWAQRHLAERLPAAVEPPAFAVSNVVSKLLPALPDERYRTAADLHDDLARCLDVPVALPPEETSARAPRAAGAEVDRGRAAGRLEVLELTRVLSNETVRWRLLRALTRLLTEQAGARRAVFLSVSGGRWALECSAGPVGGVPTSIIDQVVCTRERVLVDDASVPNPHSSDPYIAAGRPRSLACLPIIRHTDLLGALYLEDDLVPAAFTDDRLALVELLAELAGISLESARLHAEMLREIAERQQAEATLRAILDNMVDAVLVCDRSGWITFTNPAALRLYGLRNVASGGKLRVEDFARELHPVHPNGEAFRADELPLLRALAGEILSSVDMTVRHPETGRATHLRLSAAPLQDARGALAGAISLGVNVTEAIELDRLKEQFIRIVAHELKTPIAIVKGYADLLRHADAPAGHQRRLVDALIRGTDRIDRLVTDLLILWQLQTGRLVPAPEANVDLVDLAERLAGRFERETGRHVEVVSSPAVITADRQLIERAIGSVVDNALRYSPGSGDVRIRVGTVDGGASIEIEDHGIGIPKEKQADIFEPFYRAHTDTPYDSGGLGLGLYVARAIATLHGGGVMTESKEGEGSTFRITLRRPVESAERTS
ncbi:MAG: GAF domain-containing protein [Myxococcales bacterium]|nr:GAF domain-containing protein [Myxococcales bacterium]